MAADAFARLTALFICALTLAFAGGAAAQRVNLPGAIGTPFPVITHIPTPMPTPSLTPTFKPSIAPVITPYQAPPTLAAPLAPTTGVPTPAPQYPAVHAVRFRCELMPQEQSCREPTEVHDGGGDASECNCVTDPCYDIINPATGLPQRICEKH